MRIPRLRTLILAPLLLFALFYIATAVFLLLDDDAVPALAAPQAEHRVVAIFGASGTAGDGILKAALASADISEIKVRAENTLFDLAEDSSLRVIAYRPDYIGPTEEEAHLGQDLLYWFFAPVSAAVRATQIGQAMFEVTARGPEFENGDRLGTRSIIRYSDAYQRRQRALARSGVPNPRQ